jgi:RNA polymerase sigma factor (sigma-70 family)
VLRTEALRARPTQVIADEAMTGPARDASGPLGPGAIPVEIDDLVISLEREHAPAMFGFVRRLGLSPEQAEDAVQDVLLRLWAALDSGAVIDRPVGWCFKSLYRRAMDEHRLRRRIDRIREAILARPRSAAADPAAQSESIWLEVDRLPARQREVLYLRYRADLGFDEIARVLGITAGGARANATKAIASLRRALPEDAT